MEKLHSAEQRTAYQLMRTWDAYALLSEVVEEAAALGYSEEDIQNARDEVRIWLEDANSCLAAFKREHGIPEE